MNSRLRVLGGNHISGGINLMHLKKNLGFLSVFLGGEFGILEGENPPQEIAGINTARTSHCSASSV